MRLVRVRELLVLNRVVERQTLVLVVGSLTFLFAHVVALPFTFPCAFVLTDRAAPTPLAPGSPCIVLANDFCLSLVIRLVNNSRTNLEVAHLQRLIKIDGLYYSKRSNILGHSEPTWSNKNTLSHLSFVKLNKGMGLLSCFRLRLFSVLDLASEFRFLP